MINAPCSRLGQKLKWTLALLLAGALLSPARAAGPWHLLIEPSYMGYESAWPIIGAERTVLVPARVVDGEVSPLKRAEVAKLGITRQDILKDAPENATQVLSTLKPEYVRDNNQVIQYAVLESESQLTASAVLAPGFSDLFTETLGPDILIAIPSRFRIYVFPKLSPAYKRLNDIIIAEYESSPYPVSRELFAIRNGKLMAVGYYR